ncbi:TraX family protein [Variovorax sp. LjRoot178]|uniref:TraX family protein n=1 Tax=Variovorax sp. LjRoot178 TaxID=3342277 RepID=UPI003F514131
MKVPRAPIVKARGLQVPARGKPQASMKAWSISNGSLEALKWVSLVLMTGDHVNKYLLHEASPALYALGRMAVPLFGFVLMVHLARPGALQAGIHLRIMQRLAIFALLATPAFIHLVGGWPLNILATLFLATLIVWLLERGGRVHRCAALVAFLFGGAMVEFWWPALLCCLGAWAFLHSPSAFRLLLWALATASLAVINGNFAALAALPLIWGASQVDIPMPRKRWVFYAFYPAHLTLIALVQQLI